MATTKNVSSKKGKSEFNILDRSVILTLWCSYYGNNRKVGVTELVEEADGQTDGHIDPEQFRASKKLIDGKLLSGPMRCLGRSKEFLRKTAIQAHHVFGERSYLVAEDMVDVVDEYLTKEEKNLRETAKSAAQHYSDAIKGQKDRLKGLFDKDDYVTPEEFEASFALDWSYVSFAAPDNLVHINRAIANREKAKHQTRLSKAYDVYVHGLRQSAMTVVTELLKRLAPREDGKRVVVRETALRDLEEFVKLMPKRNIGDDSELEKVMKKLADRARGIDPEALRGKDGESMRAELATMVEGAKADLAKLITVSRRAISFGEVTAKVDA